MDTTQLLYLAGAFLLGFFFAWFMGRSGPKRALEECEANAHSLQRTLDDRARTVASLEGQLKQQVAQVDRLGTERSDLASKFTAAEESAAAVSAELTQLQQQLAAAEDERLRLEAELGHMRGAYADTRTRLAALVEETEIANAAAEVEAAEDAAEAEEFVEEVTTALAVAEEEHTAELDALTRQVQTLETELSATRAALARASAQVALRPELTTGKRQEYAALAGDADRIVAALHERDIAVADARNEVDYLRRTIGMLTAMGAELANEVERRRREQQLLVYEVAGLNAVTRNMEMKQLPDMQAAAAPQAQLAVKSEEQEALETRMAATAALNSELQSQLDERSKELADLKLESDPLQANLDELQAEIEALNAAKADLEAQVAARDTELTETKEKFSAVQTDAEGAAQAKTELQAALAARGVEWDQLLARINALNDELAAISAAEPATEAAAEAPAETPAETPAAPSDEVAAIATSAAAESSAAAIPQAARAADAAIPVDAAAGEHTGEPGAEPSAAVPAEQKVEAPAQTALAKLSAGVAAAVALFKRKNAQLAEYEQRVNVLAGEKGTLESTVTAKDQVLVSTQGKVEELQTALSQRSARFDALSMHASGLEAEMEVRQLDRSKLEAQVREVAASLQELAAAHGVNPGAAEAPAADPAAAVDAAVAEGMPVTAGPDALNAPAAAAAGTPEAVAQEAGVPEQAPAPVSTIDALTASAAAVAAVVRSKQSTLQETEAQLSAAQEQLAAIGAARDALNAELESRGLNLSDVQAKLAALQGDLGGEQGVRAALERKLNEFDAELQGYLAEYADPADLAPAEGAPAEGAPVEETAAPAAVGDGAVASKAAVAGEGASEPVAEVAAAAPAPGVKLAAKVALVGAVLKRRKDAVESANARIGELEDEIGALTSQKTELEGQIEQNEQTLAELNEQLTALQGQLADANTQLADANTQLADANGQHEAAQAEIARLTAEMETLQHQMDTVQAELTATDEERQRLQGQLDELNTDLSGLAAAWDAGDDATVTTLAEKLAGMVAEAQAVEAPAGEAPEGTTGGQANGEATRSMAVPLAASAGAVAVATTIRKKQLAMQDASAQLASAQEQQEALTTAKADLETQYQAQTTALEEAKAQLEALQQQLEAAAAAHTEELQTIDQKTAELQAQYNEAEAQRLQLQAQLDELTADQEAAKALLAERDAAAQEAQTRLEAVTLPVATEKTVSDFKAAARAAAEARGVPVRSTMDVQDLSQLKHIGVTFEQRLYRAGAGTFWEVAQLTNDDFELVLKLTEMQQLAMDMNEVRSDAVRLAEETETVGLLSEGETPDDFEPIQGIGKIFEQRLYSAGIRTYRQLADTSEEQLAEICRARKPLVPDYGSWIRQARIFLEVRASGK
jgi:chromosome segregation ATPase